MPVRGNRASRRHQQAHRALRRCRARGAAFHARACAAHRRRAARVRGNCSRLCARRLASAEATWPTSAAHRRGTMRACAARRAAALDARCIAVQDLVLKTLCIVPLPRPRRNRLRRRSNHAMSRDRPACRRTRSTASALHRVERSRVVVLNSRPHAGAKQLSRGRARVFATVFTSPRNARPMSHVALDARRRTSDRIRQPPKNFFVVRLTLAKKLRERTLVHYEETSGT